VSSASFSDGKLTASLGDTFRWKGENVSTAEVADILGQHPHVHEANVYGVSLPNHDGRAGCAAIELSSAAKLRPDWKGLAQFARANLPRYAVPLFIRVVGGETGDMGTHNHKQDKMPYRTEGVDPALRGTKVPKGGSDEIYWLPPKEDAYVPFTQGTWNDIVSRKLKL
jgi:acyl-CoA synthetase (AMP-forming)/AMP-acid ligase II